MRIACLAWGSLLWKTGPLALASPWYDDGPCLPLEFCRVGDGGELSTAICKGAALQRAWWSVLETHSVAQAREQLRQREAVDIGRPEWIGSLPSEHPFPYRDAIGQWMRDKALDAIVWTALPPRHAGIEGLVPGAAEAVAYLAALEGATRRHAEDYVRRVPARFDTATRSEIARQLGWKPV